MRFHNGHAKPEGVGKNWLTTRALHGAGGTAVGFDFDFVVSGAAEGHGDISNFKFEI